jgi:hypothetical protein
VGINLMESVFIHYYQDTRFILDKKKPAKLAFYQMT